MSVSFPLDDRSIRKGQLWARALRRKTLDYWYATMESADAANIEAALAAVAVNVLDETVFEAAHQGAYRAWRRSNPLGRVVMGLELIRNCELHAPEVAQLREHARFGVPGAGTRLVLHWPRFEDLPDQYRTRESDEPRARGEARDAYRKWVAGRPVIETLLDAIAFFESLSPRLVGTTPPSLMYSFVKPVPLGTDGERFVCRPMGLDQFAVFLPDLACRNTERRAPSWPSADGWLSEELKKIRREPPAASCREITTRIEDESGKLIAYGGLSGASDDYFRGRWIERAKQVGRDVRGGYRYFVSVDDLEVDVIADQQLAVTAPRPDRDELLALTSDGSSQLLEFLELLERNPDLYRGERLLS